MVNVIPGIGRKIKKKKKDMMGQGKVPLLNFVFIFLRLEGNKWMRTEGKLYKYALTDKNHYGFSKVK